MPTEEPQKSEENLAKAPKKRSLFNWRQSSVLSDRYLETVLADYKGTALLLLQAPLLAGMAVLVWENVSSATASLYFVIVLSGLWIGCMDACREIVKERALFLRERMVNLEVGAYLMSKFRVLFLLNLVQVVVYVGVVDYFLDVRVPLVALAVTMLLTTVCGTCLGLLISSAVKRSDYAVALVPLVILPQILFSEFAIHKDDFAGVSEVIYALMPSRWGYEGLIEFAETDIDYLDAVLAVAPLPIFAVAFLVLAYPLLRFQKY